MRAMKSWKLRKAVGGQALGGGFAVALGVFVAVLFEEWRRLLALCSAAMMAQPARAFVGPGLHQVEGGLQVEGLGHAGALEEALEMAGAAREIGAFVTELLLEEGLHPG